jgi:hypothetical protein
MIIGRRKILEDGSPLPKQAIQLGMSSCDRAHLKSKALSMLIPTPMFIRQLLI